MIEIQDVASRRTRALKLFWERYINAGKSIKFLLTTIYCKYLILGVLTQLLPIISWGQNGEFNSYHALARLDSLEQRANYYSENHPIEKVYVHFDKPFYILGEESWYKAYVGDY